MLRFTLVFSALVIACIASFQERRGFLECVCSPANKTHDAKARALILRALSILNAGTLRNPRPVGNRPRARVALKLLVECSNQTSLMKCIDADASLRNNPFPNPICSYDMTTGLNVNDAGGNPDWKTTAKICKHRENQPKDGEINIVPKFANEGCVAIKHLKGYHLQHRKHLLRPVICWNDFCSTPNHAIVVGGKYTSIGRMCQSGAWKNCRKESMLVNNLRIVRNSQVVLRSRDIVITAFDIRYPRIATWIIQLVQEVPPIVSAVMNSGNCLREVFCYRRMIWKTVFSGKVDTINRLY